LPALAVGFVTFWADPVFVVEEAVTAGSAFWDIFCKGRSVVIGEVSAFGIPALSGISATWFYSF
jgi:hypothetical protein